MTSQHPSLTTLTDDQLLVEARRLVARECEATADLLRCLIELDVRRLYLREGCASLFTYCTEVLHLAEGAAYNRIEVARLSRRYPLVLDRIGDGSLTLTTARMLAPHLTIANHVELVEVMKHKSKREVELLIAARHPRAAVPTVLRKVAAPSPVPPSDAPSQPSQPAVIASPVTEQPRPRHSSIAPLSSSAYKLQVTLQASTHEKLSRARDLLRHSIPNGDVATVLDRALSALLRDLERQRCAAAARPREQAQSRANTRHIPAAVKRQVWSRDGGRCAFRSSTRRCNETAWLEFHHVTPYAEGGLPTIENIELRCRAHNQYEGSLLFGEQKEIRETAAVW